MRAMSLLAAGVSLCAWGAGDRVQVRVDARFELMSVVQILAGYEWTGRISKTDTVYRRDVNRWFAQYKEHPAVKSFAAMSRKGYTFDGPAGTMACLSAAPELKLTAPAKDCGAGRAGGAQALEAWLGEVRDFVHVSDFMSFYRAHEGLYELMVEQTRAKIQEDYAGQLENYYGRKQNSYRIVLTPLLQGNYGTRVPAGDGAFDIYGVLGASGVRDGVPDFGTPEGLRALVWHEFGHSFANPVVDALASRLGRSEKLFQPIRESMRKQAYGSWLTVVREHVDRAVTVRLAYLHLGEEAGTKALAAHRSRGFAYVPALVERLAEYEGSRTKYPDFASFGGRLMDVFDELSGRELGPDYYRIPFDGTLNSVFTLAEKRAFIYPTAEKDPAQVEKIREYVKKIAERMSAGSPVLSDKEAIEQDLKDMPILAYGTLEGNLWLRKHRDLLPVRIMPEAIQAGKEFAGRRLRLIAVMPHPANPKLAVSVYTAQDAQDVAGINSVFHGPTSWVVADGDRTLGSGNYRMDGGRWRVE